MNSAVQFSLPLQLLVQLRGGSASPGPNNSICGSSSVQIQSPTLPDGYVAYPDVGVAYKVHNETMAWQVARKQCNMEGADLALIDSYMKLDYVLRQRYSTKMTHVGILRMYDDQEWIGISTGLPASTIPWANGEPTGPTDCVMVKNSEKGLGNFNCNTRGDYVCEIPIPVNYGANEHELTAQISAN